MDQASQRIWSAETPRKRERVSIVRKERKERKKKRRRTDLSAQPDHFGVVADNLLRLVELLHGDRRLSALGLLLEAIEKGTSTALRVSAGEDVKVAGEGVDDVALTTTSGTDVGLVRSEVGGVERETKVSDNLCLGSCGGKCRRKSARSPWRKTG